MLGKDKRENGGALRAANAVLSVAHYLPFALVWVFLGIRCLLLCLGVYAALMYFNVTLASMSNVLNGIKIDTSASGWARYVWAMIAAFSIGIGLSI